MLIVLRHAETIWNEPPKRCQGHVDVPLSEGGRLAARELGARLPLPRAVYVSHLRRARETAELLVGAAVSGSSAPAIVTDHRLSEAFCGVWEGLLHDELRARWPEEWQALARDDPGFAFPGGESLVSVLGRFREALEELDQRHAQETAWVVSHGGPIRIYLASRSLVASAAPGGPPGNLQGFVLDRGVVRLLDWRDAPTSGPPG